MSQSVYPYITMRDAGAAIEFYKRAFNAVETQRDTEAASGRIRHAEFKIGDSSFMVHDEVPQGSARSVEQLGGSPVNFFLYCDDVDALYAQAIAAGAGDRGAPDDKPYGRSGGVSDPFGFTWWLCTAPAQSR